VIISASRRTDIPSNYSDWFFNRIREGFVCVRNPMNPHQVSRISLTPDVVDGIVFWTKNPAPMLYKLDALRDYSFYFQFTLNPYGVDVEQNLPSKRDAIIPTFRALSAQIGKQRVVWRYDPIFLNEKYTIQYHVRCFRMLCGCLADCTEKCTVSFLDLYRNMQRRIAPLSIAAPTSAQTEELMGHFASIAKAHGIEIDTCAEAIDLIRFGISHASCIDRKRLERIAGCRMALEKDKNQRPACGCAASIDIGTYNTCQNGCVYCYANWNQTLCSNRTDSYDSNSPLLCSKITPQDIVRDRIISSCKIRQVDLTESMEEKAKLVY